MEDTSKLSIAEEMLLLILDDENGTFLRLSEWSLKYALSGSMLMQLALDGKIDFDLEELRVIDSNPTGVPVLDHVLREIGDEKVTRNVRYWVERMTAHAEEARESALQSLVDRGILEQRESRFLWVFRSRRYPLVDGHAEKEVRLRLMEVLFSDRIPDPRDVVLLCLAHVCGVFRNLLSAKELEHAIDRIEQVRRLDLIGQAMVRAIWDIEISLAAI